MSVQIERVTGATGGLTVTSDPATTGAVPLGPSAGGLLHCVSTSTNGAITVSWHAQFAADSPSFKLHDSLGVAVTGTIAPGNCCELPAALFGAMQVRIVAETPGQSAVVRVSLKG